MWIRSDSNLLLSSPNPIFSKLNPKINQLLIVPVIHKIVFQQKQRLLLIYVCLFFLGSPIFIQDPKCGGFQNLDTFVL